MAYKALPNVYTLADCTDFQKTVLDFQPQFYALGASVLEVWTDVEQLKNIYLTTNPLVTAVALSLVFSPIAFIAAEFNRNYSQIDRFWSVIPTFYNAHYALWATLNGLPTGRLYTVLGASLLWSVSTPNNVVV
jgi:hypothetical protein